MCPRPRLAAGLRLCGFCTQAKFFLLMDDIADIYLMGMDKSFIGRHHVAAGFHQSQVEDQMASTGIPSLSGYGVAELEPFESQERG